MTGNWTNIIVNAKDALELDAEFEPTDEEFDALDDCVYLLEHLGLAE